MISVIVLSFNTLPLLKECLGLLQGQLKEGVEILVVDNASTDGSVEWLQTQNTIKTIYLKENVGFGKGNNMGLRLATGKYTLLLNSDVLLKDKIDFQELISFLEKDEKRATSNYNITSISDEDVAQGIVAIDKSTNGRRTIPKAALTVELKLSDGTRDPANHRGFPTPWNAFCYFTGLEKLSSLFGGYHLTSKDMTSVHEIDCPNAAFFLVKTDILKSIDGFDEDYFMYGEDIDLCYRIKEMGYSIWYYPKF
ncbi:MAG: glycosyltransferase family 2 protein, partial [Patescibacteria group bacterium]